MIDGLPAFPDEEPSDDWKELRLAVSGGMVTIRRGANTIVCVVWGNADAKLNEAWERVVWACAAAGGGAIGTPGGPATAEEFARASGISPIS
jgi:hypothetical protein